MTTQLVGKRVFDDLYVHLSAVEHLHDAAQRELIQAAAEMVGGNGVPAPNVAKVNTKSGRLTLLFYDRFEEAAFPVLAASWLFSGGLREPIFRSYGESLNPPILHRKELLVSANHPGREKWVELTRTAEGLGLFDDTSTIGFRLNWEQIIRSKGYELIGDSFVPLANVVDVDGGAIAPDGSGTVQRHLTALVRSSLSAPVQLLIRSGLLDSTKPFFDYGCGRGGDVATLSANGYVAGGWDPHYAADAPINEADVVNLGFVVNVIEDPAERVDAIRKAFVLAREVMAIGVMLYGGEPAGKRFGDGFLTSRNTFQKYFTQGELKDYVEHVLSREAFMVAPGVCFVFASSDAEQKFSAGRYRSRGIAERLLALRVPPSLVPATRATRARTPRERLERPTRAPRLSSVEAFLARARPALDALWTTTLELGREPEPDEVENLEQVNADIGSLGRAQRLLRRHYDLSLLQKARGTRTDDLRLFFAMQQFGRRPAFRSLEAQLQRDVKAFFGDYRSALASGLRLLTDAANVEAIRTACQVAAANGLGSFEEERALQLHVSLIDRLPIVLRAYVACGLLLYGAASEFQLIKIHVESGKLTLLEYENFDSSPLPTLVKRIKVIIRRQTYDTFEYGSPQFPKPLLYWKSRYLHEDMPSYAEQLQFDEQLEALTLWDGAPPSPERLRELLEERRLSITGFRIGPSQVIPDLDQRCGANLTYRDFIECGETQARVGIANLPLRADSYNALYDLAVRVLDPVIDYFGAVRLTYGFSSAELAKNIHGRIAPKLDQHGACEVGRSGRAICERGGASCDFIVDDESMREVADWIIENVPFDRLYFYGDKRPLHVSFGPAHSRVAYEMAATANGALVPRPYRAGVTQAQS